MLKSYFPLKNTIYKQLDKSESIELHEFTILYRNLEKDLFNKEKVA